MDLDLAPSTWQLWCYATLALTLVMVVEADLREHRIPNIVVLLMMCAGVLLNTVGPANGREGLFSQFPGAIGAMQALFGVLVGLALFLPMYLGRAMGAGDVKLLAALGAFAGPVEIISLALCILVAGGALAVAHMVWNGKSRAVLGNVKLVLGGLGGLTDRSFDPATQSAARMPYALAFAGGLLAYACWRTVGGLPWISF
jgi:prepilin peptidase CpaA